MELFDNHKKLFSAAGGLFIGLTILVAIIPALNNDKNFKPLPDAVPLSAAAERGKQLYIANGCVGCHSQQVRNVDMDKMWGKRPSIAADYADIHRQDLWRNTATLMGTERTGPDLTDVGNRQGNLAWNLVHLFNPRIVVKESIMPSYEWMFEMKEQPDSADVIVNVPPQFLNGKPGKVVASRDALDLVAYLQSLKQTPLPDGTPSPDFLYKRNKQQAASAANNAAGPGEPKQAPELDGAALYATHCQSCHQENGEGLAGAFPPLKGSKVVLDDNSEFMVNIIMNGYSGRVSEGFGPMPAVGTVAKLTPEEIAAIMNHEKTSWGNKAKKVSPEEIKKLMDMATASATQ
jgi:cytochrome c oxidase cbb3-type subunit 2